MAEKHKKADRISPDATVWTQNLLVLVGVPPKDSIVLSALNRYKGTEAREATPQKP